MGILGLFLGVGMYGLTKAIQVGLLAIPESVVWICFTAMLVFVGLINGKMISLLHQWAYRDFLTGVWNRKYFTYRIKKEMLGKKQTKQSLCLALVDLDNFKRVNDTYGHGVGDEVIKQVANVLMTNVRYTDSVVRLGGDEFAIIFPGTEIKKAKIISERIRKMVDARCEHVTVSVGLVEINDTINVSEVMDLVDSVLYKAKLSKNSVIAMVAG
jgi:diguanylate cyclase (GGDEF)-like protein